VLNFAFLVSQKHTSSRPDSPTVAYKKSPFSRCRSAYLTLWTIHGEPAPLGGWRWPSDFGAGR